MVPKIDQSVAMESVVGNSRWVARDFIILAAVLGLATFLRFFALGAQPLWLDEGYSWWDAQQSLHDLWNLVPQCDPHPPLYFVVLKGWISWFGDGEVALRALSAVAGVMTTLFIILAGREISRRVGWLAGIFFALTPFQIEFGHEARPYALFCLGASLVAYGGLRVANSLRGIRTNGLHISANAQHPSNIWVRARTDVFGAIRSRNLGGWIALALGLSIILWTNNTSVLIVASLIAAFVILFSLDRTMRPLVAPLLVVMVLVALVWLPYVPVMIEQARGVSSDFWIQRPEGWRFPNELRFLVSLNAYDAVWWAVAALGGGLLLMVRRGAWRQAIMLGMLATLPVLLNYAVSMTIKPIFIARALIGIAPAVVIIMAASISLLGGTWLRRGLLVMMFAAHGFALYNWYIGYMGKEPWDRIATEVIAKNDRSSYGSSDSIVLLTANELALPLSHALEDMHATIPMQGAPANFPSPGLNARYPSGKCTPSVAAQDLSLVARAVKGHQVVYFITRRNNVYDPGNRVAKFLQTLGLIQTDIKTYMPGYLEVHKFVVLRQVIKNPTTRLTAATIVKTPVTR